MPTDLINMSLAFIEGFALIISPCILPILPIILSGSFAGNKARPLGIITGFVLTFTLVTLFSKAIIQLAHLNPDTLRNVSFGILILLALVMMSSYLTEKFNLLTQRFTRVGASNTMINNPESGFFGGLIFGGLVGIIWTPCAGPILAAVIVQVVTQKTTLSSVLAVIAFAIGAGVPMLLIALIGRKIMDKFRFFQEKSGLFRKLLGLIIIATVVYLMLSAGTVTPPSQSTNHTQSSGMMLINGLEQPYPAPEIAGIDAWINTPPLQLNELKGKVILIDFWTYSCINCIRTLPYLKDWYAKYHDQGLVIIGIHSPEFQFEHNLENVKAAVEKDDIHYPVALDNNFATWQNFHNQYWPAHYLIDKNGKIVYEHFGEGEYDVTENNIRYLLGLSRQMPAVKPEETYSIVQTPETYLGYLRARSFASPEIVKPGQAITYSYPDALSQDSWALKGKWIINADNIVAAEAGATIKLHFYAGKVYAVMGVENADVPVKLSVTTNSDIQKNPLTKSFIVSRNQLYTLVELKQEGEGTVELTATRPGLEMYTFTFGS